MVIDIAGPVPFAVDGARLAALAQGRPAPEPYQDPDVMALAHEALAAEPAIAGYRLLPGEDGTDLTRVPGAGARPGDRGRPGAGGRTAGEPADCWPARATGCGAGSRSRSTVRLASAGQGSSRGSRRATAREGAVRCV